MSFGLASFGAGLFDSAYGTMMGESSRTSQNRFNARQAQLNRDFQERMSSTAWQRGVADMRAAGINPILAASKGGASTPSGGQASGSAQQGQKGQMLNAILAMEQIKSIQAQTRLTNAKANITQMGEKPSKDVRDLYDMLKDVVSDKNIQRDVGEFFESLSTKAQSLYKHYEGNAKKALDSLNKKTLDIRFKDGERWQKYKGKWRSLDTGKIKDVL